MSLSRCSALLPDTSHPTFGVVEYISLEAKLKVRFPKVIAPLNNPPSGVEVVREFQEFQELHLSQNNFKRQECVAKIKRRKVFDRRAFVMF